MARWWGKNIKINGEWLREANDNFTAWMGANADQWEAEVQALFRKLEYKSETGKALIDQIAAVGEAKRIVVVPIRAANFAQTGIKPTDWRDAMKDKHQWHCGLTESCPPVPPRGTAIVPHSRLLEGTGKGSTVRLYFHPGTWAAADQTRAADVAAGIDTLADNFQPDDVLFHELVHAYRSLLGIFEAVPTGDTWDATEEFFAIVLSNIYVSETRPDGVLRGDHRATFHSLAEAGRDESAFVFATNPQNAPLLKRMMSEMKGLTDRISETTPSRKIAAWNPLRIIRLFQENSGAASPALEMSQ